MKKSLIRKQRGFIQPKVSFQLHVGILFSLVFLLSIRANAYVQKNSVSLNLKRAPISQLITQIETQTDYKFVYKATAVPLDSLISISAKNKPVETVLTQVFKGTTTSFRVLGTQIFLTYKKKPQPASAQKTLFQQIIKGKVVDKNGVPIPGVKVALNKDEKITVTNAEGEYTIPARPGDKLSFSMLGFETRTIKVESQVTINISLKDSSTSLDEVVINGYDNTIERRNTGAVDKVEMADLLPQGTKIDNMLQGAVPGLNIIRSSGEVGSVPIVKIRGTSTLTGNSQPLWVLDGVPLENPVPLTPAELNSPDVVNRIGNALSGINPEDIKSITILKDASATAIYGVRAAGGVIVLTTKRGKKGKPKVHLDFRTSITQRPSYKDFNLMNSKERIEIEKYYFDSGLEYYNSDANVNSVGLAGAYARYKDRQLATWEDFQREVRKAQAYNTDWFSILFRNPISTSENFNISGGSDNFTYYASLGNLSQKGTDILTNNKRTNASLKLNAKLTDYFDIELYLSTYTRSRESYPRSLVPSGISNFTRPTPKPFDYAINTSRTFPVRNPDGSFYMYRGHSDFYLFNILNEYENSNQKTRTNSTTSRITLNLTPLPNFKIFGLFNYTKSGQSNKTYYKQNTNQVAGIRMSNYGEPTPEGSVLPRGGILFSNSIFQEYYMGRITMEYTPFKSKNQYLKIFGGGEYTVNKYRGDNTIGWGYLHDRGKIISTSKNMAESFAGAPYLKIRDFSTKSASYFGVITYSFLDRYVINGNIRFDGSNLFGSNPKYRWQPAWSFSARWNIMDEPFLKGSIFNNLALRASYGLQGSINGESTPQIVATFRNPAYWSGLNLLSIDSPANPDLRWEKTYNTNIGLDFSLLKGRIQGAIDVYYRKSKDLITLTRISETNGFSTLPINFADMNNKGIEFGITTKNIYNPKPGFNWSTTINFAYNKNKVTKINIDPNVFRMLSSAPYKPDAAIVGKPMNSLYSVKFDHLDNKGIAHFKKANGEITTATSGLSFEVEDLVYNGPIEAPYQGGIINLFEYGNFKLSTLFTYGFGNYFRKQKILESWMYSPDQNLNKELLRAWKKPGDEKYTNIPHIKNETGTNNHKEFWNNSDIRVFKGDYLRLSNVTLQYYLPKNLLSSLKLSEAYIQLEGNNLLLFADDDLNGYDPETFPYQSLPIPTSYLISLNLTF